MPRPVLLFHSHADLTPEVARLANEAGYLALPARGPVEIAREAPALDPGLVLENLQLTLKVAELGAANRQLNIALDAKNLSLVRRGQELDGLVEANNGIYAKMERLEDETRTLRRAVGDVLASAKERLTTRAATAMLAEADGRWISTHWLVAKLSTALGMSAI